MHMKILHLLSTIDPRAGGPTEGVRQSGISLQSMGHEVEVVTLDDPAAPWLAAFPLTVHALGPSKGNYGLCPQLVPWLREHAARFDAVIVNGLWQYHSYGTWKALRGSGVPYYVFPHGMLDPWFKRTYPLKHLKKWLYWPWAEYRVLRDAERVLFTAQEERVLARQSFWLYRANEEVVAFGTNPPPTEADRLRAQFIAAYPSLADKRLILFLGRIHEKKGCDLLIKAFAAVRDLDANAHLVMAGPDGGEWGAQLQGLAREAGHRGSHHLDRHAERRPQVGRLPCERRVRAAVASGELRHRGGRGARLRAAGADLRQGQHLARGRGGRRGHRGNGYRRRRRRDAAPLADPFPRRRRDDARAGARDVHEALHRRCDVARSRAPLEQRCESSERYVREAAANGLALTPSRTQ